MALIKITNYIDVDLRALRLEQQIGLREVCRLFQIDASNYSKIERNLLPITQEQYESFCFMLKNHRKILFERESKEKLS